jgi:hypothetical protein
VRYKNKTRTFWQVKNGAECENFLTDCFPGFFAGAPTPSPTSHRFALGNAS